MSVEVDSAGGNLTRDEQVDLLRQMILIRAFDLKLLEIGPDGDLDGAIHPYTGQEAVAVGVCSTLRRTDRITSNHRGHGHCLAKGARADRMMAELFGRETGYCRGQGGSMHIADFDAGMLGANGIVGAGMPIAMGSALAAKVRGEDIVSAAFFSDGAAGAGPIHESLNIASLWQLPVIFVCENNGWASGQPTEKQIARDDIAGLADAYGIPGEVVDGNDLLAVRATAERAVSRARAGEGATFIEAKTFRMNIHSCSPRLPATDSRDPDVLDRWRRLDPIQRWEADLRDRGIVDNVLVGDLRTSVDHEIAEAIAFAKSSPYPDPQAALASLFAD